MFYSDLQSLVGFLTNDPNHDRYTLSDISTELNNTIGEWNQEIKILKETDTLTIVANQRQYLLSLLVGKPLSINRVTHKGLKLDKRSKAYFDLFRTDWTQDIGTPLEFCVEATDSANLYLTLHPTPQAADAGANLVVESIIDHYPMSAATDVPYNGSSTSNAQLRPYDFYLAYPASARLLARDPNDMNNARAARYIQLGNEGKNILIQVFKALEAEEPKRMSGGRYWKLNTSWRAK